MIKNLVYIIILLLGIPVAEILIKMCGEEINAWKKRVLVISIISIILSIIIFISDAIYKIPISLSLLFIAVVFLRVFFKKT